MKLSKASVSRLKLPTGKSELIVFDDDLAGFGVRAPRACTEQKFVDKSRQLKVLEQRIAVHEKIKAEENKHKQRY